MIKVYIGVGSNLGDRASYLERAQRLVEKIPQTRFLRSSSIYETDPVGGPPQGKYLNLAWEIETALAPSQLRNRLKKIEEEVGRNRSEEKYAPREIDLDIIFYGDRVVEQSDLKIPHPRLHERRFVLEPLEELAPGFVHPILRKTVKELVAIERGHSKP